RVTFARAQRQTAGSAERRVWDLLRGGGIDGHKFRRQHPIGRYVVDFACDRLRLVIEIDGDVHQRDEVVTNDYWRQKDLEGLGWTVIRFTNDQVFAEPEQIVEAIRKHVKELGI
ncbi:MAG: endonuclease domain-containing protein, partial [Caulobacteraceae bacterium]